MKLEILSSTGKVFHTSDVVSITTMTHAGEITVLDHHISMVTVLQPGVLRIVSRDDGNVNEQEFAVGWGILETSNSEVKVLIDMLVSSDEVDIDHAQKAKENALQAMERYKNWKDQVDMEHFIQAQDQLLKSIAQLKLHKK